MEEGQTFTELLINRKRHHRNRNHSTGTSTLKQSNSDTNFIIRKEKEYRSEIEADLASKSKKRYKSMTHEHKHSKFCKFCKGINKIINKERSELSTYIENNLSFLSLLGNQRYKRNSPFLFVEDQKNKISERIMGLVPIPVKKNRTKTVRNKKTLYNLQRGIVMARRYQYGRKKFFMTFNNNNEHNNLYNNSYDVSLIQIWWKNISKIILIQKYFRGYFIRKQINSLNCLYKFMNKFEFIVLRIKKGNFMYKLLLKISIKKRRKPIKGNYISKQRNIFCENILEKIIYIQTILRKFKGKIDYKKLLRGQKFFVANRNKAYFSKKFYGVKEIYDKIIMIQFNIRKSLKNRKFFSSKNINKGIGTFYVDKNYIDEYSMKIINFYNIMLHRLRLITMKKIRSSYKPIREYNKDDINKIIMIQKIYLKHYYNKYIKKLKWNKKIKKIGIIDKLRIKNNLNKIKFIQNIYRKHNLQKIKLDKKLIKNKPISSSVIKNSNEMQLNIKPIKRDISNNKYKSIINYNIKSKSKNNKYNKNKNEIEESNYQSNGILINNICFYSKEYKINQMKEILMLQTKIYSFLFLKNLRKNRKYINKKDFNSNFLVTKINSNEIECIEKIKKIQKIFKREYNNMKNNIVENYNSKTSTESNESKSNNKIPNNKNKRKPSNNRNNKNVIPKSPLKGYTYQITNLDNGSNKNKYYTKFKNDNINENEKVGNYNFSISEAKRNLKNKKSLREKLNKNKTPKSIKKGSYISKKRVEKYSEENYLTFNKNIFHRINKIQCYINKKRLYNNEPEIKRIQNFWKKICLSNIAKKPINNYIEKIKKINNKEKENDTFKTSKFMNYNISPKRRRKKINLIKNDISTNTPSYNNSNIKKYSSSQYDNDEYSDNNSNENSINSSSNYNNQVNDNMNNTMKPGYIRKIRKMNILKYILLLQNYIRNFLKRIKYIKKLNADISFINKSRIDITTYNKFLKFVEESRTIIKIEKNNKNYYIENSEGDNINENTSSNYKDIYFITKRRYLNFLPDIEKIQKNWRIKLKSKIVYKKYKPKKSMLTKLRIRNNENEIFIIQNKIRKRIFNKNKTVSRKNIITSLLYNQKRNSKSNIKQNLKRRESNGNKNRNKINKKLEKNMENYLSNNKLNNIEKLNKINKIEKLNKKKDNNIDSSYFDSNSNSEKNFTKKEFSNAKTNYISKIYKYIIYRKQMNLIGNFISKEYKIEVKKKKDFSFIKLLILFATKSTQEYIYYLLKYNTEKPFLYPFYTKTLKRVLKYLISSKNYPSSGVESGEKVKKLFSKIFPTLYSENNPSKLISSLEPETKNTLANTNIYNTIEPDFINYLNDFSKYDKHLSNKSFIETRLKNTKLINTNIFSITKFLDDEYANLIFGKYCLKCFLDLKICSCEINKSKKDDEYYYSEIDNIIDIEFDPFFSNKHQNEYDSTKWKDTTIKRKPKIEEIYEDPITNLIMRNKEELNDGKKIISGSKGISMNNTNDSLFGTNYNSNYNSRIFNKIKNDIENDNSVNNINNISKIKAIYHQNNNKKKENLILIKNNDY